MRGGNLGKIPGFGLVVLVLTLALVAGRYRTRFADRDFHITFFDVGQGDAALLRFPGGKTLLADAGGGFGDWDAGKRELFPELARLGILTLDVALLTHPDQDHGYGFLGIFQNLEVRELWLNGVFLRERRRKPLLERLLRLAAIQRTRVRALDGGESRDFGGVRLSALALDADRSTNDRPVVLLAERAGCRVLLTADMEEAGEAEWVRRAGKQVTLLKVAHHGSRTSSTARFLATARPRWAVVSAGLRNRYGHPDPGVLARIRATGAQVLRTDFHGFVTFTISPDGNVACRTAQGSCGVGRCEEGGR